MLRQVLICSAVACFAAACGRPADRTAAAPASAPSGAPAATPAPTLTIAFAAPRSRQTAEEVVPRIVGLLTDERLVMIRRDGRAQPRIAERWEVTPDGLTWRFTLRTNLTFQDGTPLTSADVRAAVAPAEGTAEGDTPPGLRDVAAVETPTPHELVLRLKRPNAFLLETLNLTPIRGRSGSRAGPFRQDSRTRDGAVLGRFKGFFRGRPALESIAIVGYPSQRDAWSAMLRGEVDVLFDVAAESFEFVKEAPEARVTSFLRPYVVSVVFNVAHPQLRRQDVRRALNMAVDRQRVIETVIGGRGLPATDHIWPVHWARDAEAPTFGYDPAAARAALDAAGLRPRQGSGPPVRMAFTCLLPADPRYERLALLIQRQLLGVGVEMRLEAVPQPEFERRVGIGKFDALLSDAAAGHGFEFPYWFWHSSPAGPFLRTGYRSADAPLDALRLARTDDETRTAARRLQRTMFDDPPAIFLYWEYASRAVSRRFVAPAEEGGDVLRTVDQWHVAPDVPAAAGGGGR